MSYLLQVLLLAITVSGWFIAAGAFGWIPSGDHLSHILWAVPFVIMLIFINAFVMFYFIGVKQLVVNIVHNLQNPKPEQLAEYFAGSEHVPQDLTPYLSKLNRFYYVVNQAKRKSIPWCMLTLTLGILAFLLGAAHHTLVVNKSVHVGVVIGYLVASTLGCYWMLKHLRASHQTLRALKSLFGLESHRM